jgi:hypothetical protein
MRPMTRIIAKRAAIAAAVFVAVHSCLAMWEREELAIQGWIVRVARSAGCQPIFESRGMMWGPGGPFYGEDAKTRMFNWLASYGPWWSELLAAFAAAMVVYAVCSRLERWRWLGYRGETRCGWCGYGLKGLKEARCPECGRGFEGWVWPK